MLTLVLDVLGSKLKLVTVVTKYVKTVSGSDRKVMVVDKVGN